MDLDRALAAIARGHHGVFAVAHLHELHASKHECQWRLETGRWVLVHDGVYRIAGTPVTWRSELLAACWAGGSRSVASHHSAAALWALPGADRDLAEITCPRWRRARHDGLIVHESLVLDPIDTTTVDAIPCTSIERTIFDMCGVGGDALADLLMDSALRRRLTTIPRLVAARDRLAKRGRRGAARFRKAVESRDPASALPESEPERMLARYLVTNGLPAPVHQYVVRDGKHRFVARVDLAYPDCGVVIEYDSAAHHTGKVALERDSSRRNAMTSLGLKLVIATAADIRDRGRRISTQVGRLLGNPG